MRQTSVFRVWNSLILIVALVPLAIFWVGRGDAFRSATGEADDALPRHLLISGMYLLAVAATAAWVRWRGRPGLIAALVAIAASVGAAMGFTEVATNDAIESGITGLPVAPAVWMLVLFAAGNAAWVALFSLTLSIRTRHLLRGRHPRSADG